MKAEEDMQKEGIGKDGMRLYPSLDMRYKGQSYEINLRWPEPEDDFLANFHAAHQMTYGYSNPLSPVEIVTIRLRAAGLTPKIELPEYSPSTPVPDANAIRGIRSIILTSPENTPVTVSAPCYYWEYLHPGNQLIGPALVIRSDTTILVNINDSGYVDQHMNLIIKTSQR